MMFAGSKKKNPPVETTAPAMPTGPVSVADWERRVHELEAQAVEADKVLETARISRRTAAGNVIVFNAPSGVLSDLENAEREAERHLDNLHSAIEVAKSELQKAQAEEARARLAERLASQRQFGLKILEHAARVDEAFSIAANELRTIETLYRQYVNAGGGYLMRLKVNAARAARGKGLRDFISADFVGDNVVSRPLVEQFRSLAGVQPSDKPLVEETPESLSA
jgi:hypothetical protein